MKSKIVKQVSIAVLTALTLGGQVIPATAATKPAVKIVKKQSQRPTKSDWFKDGLSKKQLKARNWITTRESGHHWKILSYGHRCIGYFQLDPRYLGHKNGHINLNHKHQVKIADSYVKARYGNWVHAKHFWALHHWY